MSCADPSLRFQNPPVIITVGAAPIRSSPGANARPSTGFTPSCSKNPVLIKTASTCSASPRPVRVNDRLPRTIAMDANVRLSFCQSRKFGYEIEPVAKLGLLSRSSTSCSGSGYGSGFSSTPFTTEKSAVFAPIPSASVRIATAVNPGDFARIRRPNRRSCINRSSAPQPHASRVTSRTNPTFPNSRRAACSASSAVLPLSMRSRAAISRWLRTSASSSSSRLLRHQKLIGCLRRFLTSEFLYFNSLPRYFSPGCSTPAIASESCDHLERSLVNCFFPADVNW